MKRKYDWFDRFLGICGLLLITIMVSILIVAPWPPFRDPAVTDYKTRSPDEAALNGWEAYNVGVSEVANPETQETYRNAWLKGWIKAKHEARK
jgi:ribosome modulation factor